MGADNFLGNNSDIDSLRYDRQNRLNPPEFAPGQGDSDNLFSSDFEQPVSNGGFNQFMSSSSNDIFGSSGNNGMAGSFGGFNDFNMMGNNTLNNQQQPKTDEDKFFEAITKGGKGIVGFFKDLVDSSKGLTPKFKSVYGKNVCKTCIVVAVLGVVTMLFGFNIGVQLLIGSLLAGVVGILMLMFNVEKGAECSSEYSDDNTTTPNFNTPSALAPADGGFGDLGADFGSFDDNDDFGSFDSFEDEGYNSDDDDDFGFGDEDDDFNFDDVVVQQDDVISTDEALEQLQVIDRGMYTRQYLYDNFIKVLASLKSDYSRVKTYDEDDDTFLVWDNIIQRAAAVTGLSEDSLPYLKALEENIFTIKATIERVPKMKPELVADEVAKAYAANTYEDDEDRAKVFAKVETVLDDCIITVFTGESYLISLKDMYRNSEDFVLNSKNSIPVILGINEKGKVIQADFKKIESIIVAGMPRSGKSWLVQAILTQMCALLSPKEINFYILDPKASTSDFKRFTLPHVKKFASKYTNATGTVVNPEFPGILDTLRFIVNKEAPRRKKLIGGSGCANINDFKAKYPDIDLPVIYIVIDEMVTLSAMEKEDEREYQSYLDQIVTQFPNLGIRGMFIPHEVKNQIISKTAYDSIKARISVKGSPEHIEASTGTKAKDFKYKLCNVGDMAVNIDVISAKTQFVHGVALTDDNEKNNQLFDYLRRMWSKLEPDEVENSVAKTAERDDEMTKLLNEVNNDDSDFDLFSDNQDTSSQVEVFSNSNEEGLSSLNADGVFQQEDEDDFLSDFR